MLITELDQDGAANRSGRVHVHDVLLAVDALLLVGQTCRASLLSSAGVMMWLCNLPELMFLGESNNPSLLQEAEKLKAPP